MTTTTEVACWVNSPARLLGRLDQPLSSAEIRTMPLLRCAGLGRAEREFETAAPAARRALDFVRQMLGKVADLKAMRSVAFSVAWAELARGERLMGPQRWRLSNEDQVVLPLGEASLLHLRPPMALPLTPRLETAINGAMEGYQQVQQIGFAESSVAYPGSVVGEAIAGEVWHMPPALARRTDLDARESAVHGFVLVEMSRERDLVIAEPLVRAVRVVASRFLAG